MIDTSQAAKSILRVTEDLIRIHSTADRTDELYHAIQYVADYFSDLPELVIHRYESNNKPSIVISFEETLEPQVMLVGHVDAVPAPDELFEPRYESGRLYARGACDMKSEVAVMMTLMRDFYSASPRPSLALMLTSDEEINGNNGARYLLHDIGYRAKVALVPDGGAEPSRIILKSKGVLHLHIGVRGRAAHGSRPWLGKNAIEDLYALYEQIKTLFPPTDDPEHWHSTCIVGTISGGVATNQIPDFAECGIDIRFTEEHALVDILSKIRAFAPDADIEILSKGHPMFTSRSNQFVMLYEEAVRTLFNVPELQEEITHGATDGRFFAEFGIPVIVSRPVSDDQHSPNEWLDLASLEDFKRLYERAITLFLR